jgi:hypothetical protein
MIVPVASGRVPERSHTVKPGMTAMGHNVGHDASMAAILVSLIGEQGDGGAIVALDVGAVAPALSAAAWPGGSGRRLPLGLRVGQAGVQAVG